MVETCTVTAGSVSQLLETSGLSGTVDELLRYGEVIKRLDILTEENESINLKMFESKYFKTVDFENLYGVLDYILNTKANAFVRAVTDAEASLHFDEMDSLTFNNKTRQILFNLRESTRQNIPSLGPLAKSLKISSSKQGHGSKSVVHKYLILVDMKDGELSPKVKYAIEHIFRKCIIEVSSMDKDFQPPYLTPCSKPDYERSFIKAVDLGPSNQFDEKSVEESTDVYEYLTLIFSKSFLEDEAVDGISSYSAPSFDEPQYTSLYCDTFSFIYPESIKQLISSPAKAFSVRTSKCHIMVYKKTHLQIVMWKCKYIT